MRMSYWSSDVCSSDLVLRVEGRGQALHRLRRLVLGYRIERGRRQHRFGGGEDGVALADRAGDRHGGVVGERNRRLAPFAGGGIAAQREELALDIVERLDPQDIVGRRNILDRLRLRRQIGRASWRERVCQSV